MPVRAGWIDGDQQTGHVEYSPWVCELSWRPPGVARVRASQALLPVPQTGCYLLAVTSVKGSGDPGGRQEQC
jgi:hypothetical protein